MGGNYWNQWNNRLVDVLVNKQIKTGCQCGSWSPLGKQCAAGGRIYATALNILSLEIYYRYGKVFYKYSVFLLRKLKGFLQLLCTLGVTNCFK